MCGYAGTHIYTRPVAMVLCGGASRHVGRYYTTVAVPLLGMLPCGRTSASGVNKIT